MFPDFLCIGAQKAGTTWLYENLRRQPGIWLPPVKELHFLDHPSPPITKRLFSKSSHHATPRRYLRVSVGRFIARRGSAVELAQAWHIALGKRDYDWYEQIFAGHEGLVCGEICPGYASLKTDIISEVVRRNPNVRIIYMLRDPIDRAWSSMAMHFRKSNKPVGVREQTEILQRLMSAKSRKHWTYHQNLENWLRYVPAENIYIGWFERILKEPSLLLHDILSFLGLSTIKSDGVTKPVNAGAGEKIDRMLERRIAEILNPEIHAAHRRFNNDYSAGWLAHAEAVLARHCFAQDSQN